jgi:Tfp pilus assembly protein PilE
MDMPMGQIPQSRIEEARALLKETATLIDTYNILKQSYSDRTKIVESKRKQRISLHASILLTLH